MESPWLRGAVVQKVIRPLEGVLLLSVRLPGATTWLAIVASRVGVAMGPVGSVQDITGDELRPDPAGGRQVGAAGGGKGHGDSELTRWRHALEGSRVVELRRRRDAQWWRLSMVRGVERRFIVATERGMVLSAEEADGAPVGNVGPDMQDPGDAHVVAHADGPEIGALLIEAMLAQRAMLLGLRRAALIAAIDRARAKLLRRVAAVKGDIRAILETDALVHRATLLSAHASAIPRGASEAVVDDWSTGELVPTRIPLDPSRSARMQADTLFRQAKRKRRGLPVAEMRLSQSQTALAQVAALRAEAEGARDFASLEIVRSRAEGAGGPGARVHADPGGPASSIRARQAGARIGYATYLSGSHPIYVGKSAKDNDALTTRVARPHDLWLHAKGTTGAHVVIPLDKGKACGPELLVDGAHLAAHFSDSRGEPLVEIQYTSRRYVRKPRGAAPGAVMVDRESVMILRIEPDRIQRLLATSG